MGITLEYEKNSPSAVYHSYMIEAGTLFLVIKVKKKKRMVQVPYFKEG
jgi:hypothetical protein